MTHWPVVTSVSHATRDFRSCASRASRIASEIWSATLSGWPMVTDSLVKRWVLRRHCGDKRASIRGTLLLGYATNNGCAAHVGGRRGCENVHPVSKSGDRQVLLLDCAV